MKRGIFSRGINLFREILFRAHRYWCYHVRRKRREIVYLQLKQLFEVYSIRKRATKDLRRNPELEFICQGFIDGYYKIAKESQRYERRIRLAASRIKFGEVI